MNKRFISPIALVIILGMSVFVSAIMNPSSDSALSNKIDYAVEVPISIGWNIVVGIPVPASISSNSEIKSENIKAMFYYFRQENKYIPVLGEVEFSNELESYLRNAQEKPEEIIYFAQSPVWLYSNKAGKLRYSREDFPKFSDSSNTLSLTKGWNFVTITPEMMGKSLSQIKGDCNMQKVFFWSAPANKWFAFSLSEIIDSEYIGLGLIIKVSSNCQFSSSEGVIAPPILPGIDTNTPSSFDLSDFPQSIGNYKLNRYDIDSKDCGELDGRRVCVEMARVEYFNSQDNTSIHIIPTEISEGKQAYIDYVKSHKSEENVEGVPGVYRVGESWELYWFTNKDYDLIGIQDYLYTFVSDGVNAQSRNATTNNVVVKYFLNKYPPRIV